MGEIEISPILKFHEKLFYSLVCYCFLFGVLGREIGGAAYGILIEVFLIVGFFATAFVAKKKDWKSLNNDFFYLLLLWFSISVLEVLNPNASTLGWLSELRTTALYPVMMVLLGLIIFKTQRHLDIFLIVIIALSTLATLNGLKQLYVGLSPGEHKFLVTNASTHLIWGRLRVFSFYTDAGQFGASQAHIGIICLITSLCPMRIWKRSILALCGVLNLYGMLISGTRGALFIFVVAVFVAIILSKNIRAIIIGGIFAFSFLFVLKFTHIGDGNYQIFRLRTALNPQDASLNVRFNTQRNLRVYMEDYPFGGGLGVIGYNGMQYNSDKYLSTIPPDSYYVKVWVMYGIFGFTIWFCIMMYIFGKSCGLVWNIKDKSLRIKMIALTAGFAGILVGSYGNEVINIMPTSIVIYLSWAFIAKSNILEKTNPSNLLT